MCQIEQVDPGRPLWDKVRRHLEKSGDWQWINDDGALKDGIIVLAAVAGGKAVGSISLSIQPVANLGKAEKDLKLVESFVMTFSVEPEWRRRGIGRALQLAALEASRKKGCWQMRSWSSIDKTTNYLLKLGLGFCFCPAAEHHGNKKIEGGYFVHRLHPSN